MRDGAKSLTSYNFQQQYNVRGIEQSLFCFDTARLLLLPSCSSAHTMRSSLFLAASALVVSSSSIVAADDYLVSERYALHKRQEAASKNITFLHINDVHAHLDEYRSNGVDCPRNTTENMNVTKVPCFGGYARVLERANEIRQEQPDTLFLNAGDEFQGYVAITFASGVPFRS
jgi:5'-nucleotidase